MKTKILFTAVAAAAVMLSSCNKAESPVSEMTSSKIIPDGYTEVVFAAGLEDDTKTVLDETNELQVNWTGEEKINVWYRENGTATKVAATILSYSGKNAYISAAIPSAVADTATAYYAEMNGVSDKTGKAPFGSGTTRARVTCPRVQNAVEGSFDPDAAAMGAKWTGKAGATPSFAFKQLNNLLKISIDNQTTKQIDSIVINNDASIDSTYIANVCYWDFEKGYLSIAGSGNKSRSVCLQGSIGAGQGDYYFAISVRNNLGYPELKNMSIVFYLHEGDVKYTRTFTNSTTMRNIGGYNQLVKLTGNNKLTLKESELINNTYAPFGTAWNTTSVKEANATISTAIGAVATMHAKSPNSTVTATVKNSRTKSVKDGGQAFKGDVDICFYAAESGTGIVTIALKGQKSDPANHKAEFYVNGTKMATINPEYNVVKEYTQELTVKAGDQIRIYQNVATSNETVYFYYSTDLPLTWTKKSE